jgi:hypothetical protein
MPRPIHPYIAPKRAKVAGLSRSSSATPEDLAAARLELRTANAAAYIDRLINATPPLSPKDREFLAGLLTPVALSSVDEDGSA